MDKKLPAYAQRYKSHWQTQQIEQIRASSIGASFFESQAGNPIRFSQTKMSLVTAGNSPDSDRLFKKCIESESQRNTPTGTLTEHTNWAHSNVYPATMRDFDVYLPPNAQPGEEMGLIFIADGKAAWQFATQITTVLDNLIHAKRIPRVALVLAGIGWEPNTGAVAMRQKEMFPMSMSGYLQRYRELDVCSTEYGALIIDEMLPWIEKHHNVVFSKDPSLRCMAGQSSGGLCAFNVSWTRPEAFGLTLGVSTSFCNCLPGYLLPKEVRMTPKKPLRIYLCVGEFDNENQEGSWLEHTKLMASALKFQNYEHMVEIAQGGGHTLRYTGSKLGDVLTWLFAKSTRTTKL